MKEGNILVIDDNLDILNSLCQLLKYDFNSIQTLSNPNLIPKTIQQSEIDVILLDMNFTAGVNSGNEGIFWIREIIKIDPTAVIILITAYADIDLTVKAIKEGGIDFIVKPWDPKKLITSLKAGIKYKKTKLQLNTLINRQKFLSESLNRQNNDLIGSSPPFVELLQTIEKIAPTEANVLLLGENGSGKELIAREIHKKSNRTKGVFISIDMGSISESLFESELFGYVKGAFTDAREDRMGRFESASGGTLFLDEITNLSIPLQAKILTAIQKREITRIGSTKPIPMDVRLICATNMKIDQLVADQLFREDLLYRINTIQLVIPPLRSRKADLHLLTDYFLKKYEKKYSKGHFKISKEALNAIESHQWPGNIRELKHAIERAVILCETDIIKRENVFQNTDQIIQSNPSNEFQSLAEIEINALKKVLKHTKGNLSQASKILGISRTTLYSKMEKHGL